MGGGVRKEAGEKVNDGLAGGTNIDENFEGVGARDAGMKRWKEG